MNPTFKKGRFSDIRTVTLTDLMRHLDAPPKESGVRIHGSTGSLTDAIPAANAILKPCYHDNLDDAADRIRALVEIVRVARPGEKPATAVGRRAG